MHTRQLLSQLTDEFCLLQFAEYTRDPSGFQRRIHAVIDEETPALKLFLIGLEGHLGTEAVLGATTILELLMRQEDRTRRASAAP